MYALQTRKDKQTISLVNLVTHTRVLTKPNTKYNTVTLRQICVEMNEKERTQ